MGNAGHRRARRFGVAALLTVIALAIGYGPSEPAAPAVVAVQPDAPLPAPLRIAYGSAADTFGELHLPAAGSHHPVVVLVHGGGWSQSRSLTEAAPVARSLAAHGVAVWNVEYRRVGGAGGWPVTLTDVADAVAALGTEVRPRVGDLIDLQRVHLAGHSAGGHLAAWFAGRTTGEAAAGLGPTLRIRSATLMAAVLDLDLAVTNGRDRFVRALLGGGPADVPDRYRWASPIDNLPAGLAVTALHGDQDRVVDPEQSRRWIAAAANAGNRADLRILRGAGHADFIDVRSDAWQAAQRAILHHVDTLR